MDDTGVSLTRGSCVPEVGSPFLMELTGSLHGD